MKQSGVLVTALDLLDYLFRYLIVAVLFFIAGGLCLYIPWYRLRKRIKDLTVSIFDNKDIDTEDSLTQLENYLNRLHKESEVKLLKLSHLKTTLENIISSLQEPIMNFDVRGKLLFHNPQSQMLFHFPDNTDSVYLKELTRSSDIIGIFNQCLQTKNIVLKSCAFNKKNQPFKTYFQIKSVPFMTEKDEMDSITLLFYDQTQIHQSQQAHIDFVSNVSHELKSPLTSLQGFVEILINDLKNKRFDQFEHFLNVLLKNCKRMNDLVNDLLNLSILASKTNLQKEKLSTKEITTRVTENLKTKKNHKLYYCYDANYVMAHPRWIETVLHNLLENACLHTPEDCEIYVRWEDLEDKVILKVVDNGEGIPAKYRHRVFERFFRIDPARSRKKGGTGIGLSLVQQAIEKHGGYVRVVPAKTGGSEFICEFPK